MSDLLDQVEARRLALGFSQKAVARALTISQPHYSKVVGRLTPLSSNVEVAMRDWLKKAPVQTRAHAPRSARIRALTRSIERQLRELNALIDHDGAVSCRRPPRPTRRR